MDKYTELIKWAELRNDDQLIHSLIQAVRELYERHDKLWKMDRKIIGDLRQQNAELQKSLDEIVKRHTTK